MKPLKLWNERGIGQLIVTKYALVADDKFMKIYDKNLAHIQVSITATDDNDCAKREKASLISDRIKAVKTLQKEGFDVSVRLSPFMPQYIDYDVINNIKCDKILIEFLRANTFIKRNFDDFDFSEYTEKESNYWHLPLEKKIEYIEKITGFKEHSVCEDRTQDYNYWKEHYNTNPNDCCNLRINKQEV